LAKTYVILGLANREKGEPLTSKKHNKRMNEKRVTLYFDDATKELLNDLSEELGVPKSQLMAYFLLTGVSNMGQARALLPRYLVPSESPVWRYNIDLNKLREDLRL
jgi:hypothetical protein